MGKLCLMDLKDHPLHPIRLTHPSVLTKSAKVQNTKKITYISVLQTGASQYPPTSTIANPQKGDRVKKGKVLW